MKSYLELSSISARHNRQQSRMTVLCIVLAVFLITSVFSMANFEYMHMKEMLIRKHGRWHIMLSNVSEEQAESIAGEDSVRAICRYDTCNYDLSEDFYLNGYPLWVRGTEREYFDQMTVGKLVEGRFPENGLEVLLSIHAKDSAGLDIGDTAVIETPSGEFSYTVCGFVADTASSLAHDTVIAILDYTSFETFAQATGQKHEPSYYIRLSSDLSARNAIDSLKKSYGLTENNVSENSALLGITGMSSSSYIVGLYGIAAVLVFLVVLASIMMIAGSMNTNVAQRTQYFGMLRCIGTSRLQVRRIVRREAMAWLLSAIPVGVIASIFACWGVCAILAYGIGGEWKDMPVGRISFVGIILGVLIGLITVLLSAGAPARRAAKISPITAVSGNQTDAFSGRSLRDNVNNIDISIGIHHAVTKKTNLLLMTGSFALSIILFLFFSVMLDWIDLALETNKPYTPDLSVYYEGYEAGLDGGLVENIRNVSGVKYAYGRKHILADVHSDKGVSSVDLISYDDIQFDWAKGDLLCGSIEDTRSIVNNVMVVFDKNNSLNKGDTLELNGQTLTVSALLSDSPFGSGDIPTIICSEETFKACCGEADYKVIDIQMKKSAGNETVAGIRVLLDDDMRLSDRRAVNTETKSTYLAFTALVYIFLSLVALIAVFNIINSISMSVTARHRQYGMMRAIGLNKAQLVRMVRTEALTYAVSGCLVGCVFGLPLNAWFYKAAISNYFGTPWRFPVFELLIIFAVILLAALASVRGPVKRLMECSVVDTINSINTERR